MSFPHTLPSTSTDLLQPFLDITNNPSYAITSSLPSIPSSDPSVKIIAPEDRLRASYASIYSTIPPLIKTHNPDLILHLGLDKERNIFTIEKSAAKEGYHQALDVDKKVFTKQQSKDAWGKKPERLQSSLDLEVVREKWEAGLRKAEKKAAGKGGKRGVAKGKDVGQAETDKKGHVDVNCTDDVGSYVCGFVYYLSMVEMGKRKGGKGRRDVVFCHVPWLDEGDTATGMRVVEALIGAIVEVWREGNTREQMR